MFSLLFVVLKLDHEQKQKIWNSKIAMFIKMIFVIILLLAIRLMYYKITIIITKMIKIHKLILVA